MIKILSYILFLLTGALSVFENDVDGQLLISSEKQKLYLSGTDNRNTVKWDFYCTGGRKSGFWTTIEVPSCWEQQGFGLYNYGRDYFTYGSGFKYADEKGLYRYEFVIPADWKNRKVEIVFEGSMTDTEVKINGMPAGEIHQGAFYRFRYDITDKLNFGKKNLLEITVSKMSSDRSVNLSERFADYWIFGGIFRPVYLESYPKEHIQRVAINAASDGSFLMQVYPENLKSDRIIYTEIIDVKGNSVASGNTPVAIADSFVTVNLKIKNPGLWSAETPVLYKAVVTIHDSSKKILYQTSENFGFRTIEVRHGDGIYINNVKVKMKGINRHVFWPETGRTVSREIDLNDVRLIKEMNMNAVRCSHYPPDVSFLDICDSLGLYVLDELAGWHDAYDTQVGEKLVREMVIRDVNHPSVIFWSNGNEGGTNFNLDDDFLIYDPSKRTVIHPHHKPNHAFNGIDCNHYEPYQSVQRILQDSLIYMPTEFLHSQNDGGGGAGLYDYWELMRNAPRSGGGFIWAFLDEGIVRTDLRNIIDVDGVNAPDGVVGPHREKEGSYYAIREIYAPVYIASQNLSETFTGELPLENRYNFTNLNKCRFVWKIVKYRLPDDPLPGYEQVDQGIANGPDLAPGKSGTLKLDLPLIWKNADALLISVLDPHNTIIFSRSFMIRDRSDLLKKFVDLKDDNKINAKLTDSTIILTTKGITISFSKQNGRINFLSEDERRRLHFGNGPVITTGNQVFDSLIDYPEKDGYVVDARFSGDLKNVRWKLYNSGWIEMNYVYKLKGQYNFTGVSFDYPEDFVLSAKWLGNGPYRVWKNRMQGGKLNVWENAYNNTTTGYSPWIYPEFKGYFSDIIWLKLNTVEGKILIVSRDSNLFVRLFNFHGLPGITPLPELPSGNLSFLDNIPPIGTKLGIKINAHPWTLGPQSRKNETDSTYIRTVWFYFGEPGDQKQDKSFAVEKTHIIYDE